MNTILLSRTGLAIAFITFFISFTANATRSAGDTFHSYFSETPPPGHVRFNGPVNWAQPPLGCVEEMVPHQANKQCLDLTQVANPLTDWPTNLSQADHDYWYAQRRGLTYCRGVELLRREAATPGSQTAGAVETSWMVSIAINDYDTKVKAVYEASDRYNVPAHVLTGAVYQESLFAELGISSDGGNYSCGAEQINLNGWCEWANAQSSADQSSMGWPTSAVDCNDSSLVNLAFIKPFYDIALTRLNGLPEYRLEKSHFQNIAVKDVVAQWPQASDATNALRYQLINSFINFCADPRLGILAKASELQSLYSGYLSKAFQDKDRYTGTDRFQRQCSQVSKDNAYPLHTGWLMAVAAYNAGPRAVDAVTYYNQWNDSAFNDPTTIQNFTPDKIVESIYWSGKYDKATDKIDFASRTGAARSWIWYKGCVAQRHIARVMQHVTLVPDFFVDSLEGQYPCAPSTKDTNGNVITSVPPDRQVSTGVN
jgi:hypothetical protein